jgi:cation transporter-like permease
MDVQEVTPLPLRSADRSGPINRVLANRQLWKNTIYSLAFLTYLCSFLFFGLALADVRSTGGSMTTLIDLIVAIYFLTQVIFLFVLSGVVERRRLQQKIDFPDRRGRS